MYVLVFLLVAALASLVWLAVRYRHASARLRRSERDLAKLIDEVSALRARNQALAKFEPILHIEAHVSARQREADALVDRAAVIGNAIVARAELDLAAVEKRIADAQDAARKLVPIAHARAR